MLLGIVSDTHGRREHTLRAVRMLESCQVERVIHCGDIGSADVVRLFSAWPADFVFGNVDTDEDELRRAIEAAGQTCHERFGALELAGRRIAFLHGDDERRLRNVVASGRYDLVCYGHTHRHEHHASGTTTVLNPGAVFRASPHTLALVGLPELEITHVEL